MELTEQEERMIIEHRQAKEVRESRKRYALFVLETAHKYEKWLQETGNGSTYSTFCNDFGFGGWGEISRNDTFNTVEDLRELANNSANDD